MREGMPSEAEMRERLATWIERYYVAGAALAVLDGGEVRSAAAGTANNVAGIETTPDTLFQIGSITKVYTTTLIMQLVEAGKIDLDAPAATYLPGLRFGGDAATTAQVTIRQLLSHTSGVDGDFFEDFGRGDDCVAQYVAACDRLPFVFPPGTMWSYCNAGFVVLGRIIELLTGMTWDDALRERVLKPIGAAHTLTRPEEVLLYRAAAGHAVTPSREIVRAPIWRLPQSVGPAGATPCSTVGDLLTFAAMHMRGGTSADGERVLSEASVREMQQPQFELPPQPGEMAAHWGLGWMLFDWGGRRVIGHDGGTVGQMSFLRLLPDEGFAVALLTNSTPTGGLLGSRVMRWLFGQNLGIEMPQRPQPPEERPELDLAPYVGVYDRVSFRTEVTLQDGQLMVRYINTGPLAGTEEQQPAMALHPVNATQFLQQNPYLGFYQPVTFSGFEDGRPQYVFAYRVARRVA